MGPTSTACSPRLLPLRLSRHPQLWDPGPALHRGLSLHFPRGPSPSAGVSPDTHLSQHSQPGPPHVTSSHLTMPVSLLVSVNTFTHTCPALTHAHTHPRLSGSSPLSHSNLSKTLHTTMLFTFLNSLTPEILPLVITKIPYMPNTPSG